MPPPSAATRRFLARDTHTSPRNGSPPSISHNSIRILRSVNSPPADSHPPACIQAPRLRAPRHDNPRRAPMHSHCRHIASKPHQSTLQAAARRDLQAVASTLQPRSTGICVCRCTRVAPTAVTQRSARAEAPNIPRSLSSLSAQPHELVALAYPYTAPSALRIAPCPPAMPRQALPLQNPTACRRIPAHGNLRARHTQPGSRAPMAGTAPHSSASA